ncbi:hypothetical protein FB480_104170 [Agrobacterium vitis]|nr:hypothetical protein FB480_104170 [Agrobacterium vitis]
MKSTHRGDLAGRLAATLNKLLKGRGKFSKLSEAIGNAQKLPVFLLKR